MPEQRIYLVTLEVKMLVNLVSKTPESFFASIDLYSKEQRPEVRAAQKEYIIMVIDSLESLIKENLTEFLPDFNAIVKKEMSGTFLDKKRKGVSFSIVEPRDSAEEPSTEAMQNYNLCCWGLGF